MQIALATASDDHLIASTLYLEARGEREVGLRAVASVIVNRARVRGTCARPFIGEQIGHQIFLTLPA